MILFGTLFGCWLHSVCGACICVDACISPAAATQSPPCTLDHMFFLQLQPGTLCTPHCTVPLILALNDGYSGREGLEGERIVLFAGQMEVLTVRQLLS